MSTHHVHPPGVAALERWGLLERLEATGCPPVDTYSFDFGPLTISGSPRPIDGIARGYCPRRTVLDQLLVDAAVEAGAELRDGFTVDELLTSDGTVTGIRGHAQGRDVGHRARPRRDRRRRHPLARRQDGQARAVRPTALAVRGLLRILERPAGRRLRRSPSGPMQRRAWGAIPTHDDLTVLVVRLAGRGVPREPRRHRGQHVRHTGPRARVRRACALRPHASRSSSARLICRGTSACRTAPAGRWSATPATTSTRSPRWASTTPFATRSSWPAPSRTPSPVGARTTTRMARLPADPRSRGAAGLRLHRRAARSSSRRPRRCRSWSPAMHGDQEAMDAWISVQAATLAAPEFFSPDNLRAIMIGP